jgi:hypothetical protein
MKKKSGGIKHDNGKARLGLLSGAFLFRLGEVMTDGAQRYADHNWRQGFNWSRIADAAMRHLVAWNSGMDKDPDSGRSNLAHAAACLMMLMEFEETKTGTDDRYKLSKEVLDRLYPAKKK